ncbi:Autophagy protein 22 [Stygiomarasmius scandens]|uniref:Autophagy-related protein n=1 Tax=Marasmiellus scandens TaxID=2682957 RepID=A0ABR1IVR8_9AGAR
MVWTVFNHGQGLISDLTSNIRYSFFFLGGMVWAAVPMLIWVDPERGRRDAEGYRYGVASR